MKTKNTLLAVLVGVLSVLPQSLPAQAEMLPDLVINQIQITRIEWRQMPDCDHNACQNLIWKALLEFNFNVQNQGQAAAQIPNGNFESSNVVDILTHKNDNALLAQISNWETVPNSLLPGAVARLTGRIYVTDNPALVKLQDEYILCLNITDRPSDNQNWNLLESNTKNNTTCLNFILNLPKHDLPNPKVININSPQVVVRNPDGSADIQISYGVQNTTRQVYVQNIPKQVQVVGNGIHITSCNGNIAPGLHGQENQNQNCSFKLPPGTQAGVYTLRAVVDANNRIIEANEHDNVFETQIQLL